MLEELNELPEFETPQYGMPEPVAKEQGFYAAALNDRDIVTDAKSISDDLQFKGSSSLYDEVKDNVNDKYKALNQQAVYSIISDPSLDRDVRKNVLQDYITNKDFSHDVDLRKAYMEHTAVSPSVLDTRDDMEIQDIMLSTLQDRDRRAEEVENQITQFGANLSGSASGVVGGIARDVHPVTSLTLNAQGGIMSHVLGFDGIDNLKHAAFVGHASADMNDKFKALPFEQQKEFIKEVTEVLDSVPGTDYNKYEKFFNIIVNQTVPEWEKWVESVGSAANITILGSLVKAPIRTLKEAFTVKLPSVKEALPKRPAGAPAFKQLPAPKQGTSVITKENVLEGEIIQAPNKPAPRDLSDIEEAAEVIIDTVRPRTSPKGPTGTTATANPNKAETLGKKIVDEAESGQGVSPTANAAGSRIGEIFSDWVLPKMTESFSMFPGVTKHIARIDDAMKGLYDSTVRSPFMSSISARTEEVDRIINTIKNLSSSVYQQQNSLFRSGIFESEGTAVLGRTESTGWSNIGTAQARANSMTLPEGMTARVFEQDKQWYVAVDYKIAHDPLADKLFNASSVSSKFMGVDVSGIAQSMFGKWIFPSNMRLPEWVTQGAYHAGLQTKRAENAFKQIINNDIAPLRNDKNFVAAINETQEAQRWFTGAELAEKFPDLTKKELTKLAKGYATFRRLSEYEYNWLNRYDRQLKVDAEYKGIYSDDGSLLAFGTKKFNKGDLVGSTAWDFESLSFQKIEATDFDNIVRLFRPVKEGNVVHNFAFVKGSIKEGVLPQRTIPKIDGYIPRRNTEHWYVKRTHTTMTIDGREVTSEKMLNDHSSIIGAARTQKEAEELAAKLQMEYPDEIIGIKADRMDNVDSMLLDNTTKFEMMQHAKARGERLQTLHGQSILDDPLKTLVSAIKGSVRNNMWADYNAVLQRNFVNAFGDMLEGRVFPSRITDIHLPKNATPTQMAAYKSAQQIFEYQSRLIHHSTTGDEVWKTIGHAVADIAEKIHFTGSAETIRYFANKGDSATRAAKTLTSNLFLKLNPIRQWVIQTQQQIELMALTGGKHSANVARIPSIMLALTSSADNARGMSKAMYEAAAKAAMMPRKEFDDIVKAIRENGIPEGVDMNNMFIGTVIDAERALAESKGRQMFEAVSTVPNIATNVGNKLGYGNAELSNSIGVWMYAKDRWIANNPNKRWQDHSAEISGQAWDIAHAMTTRAAAMPYQEGVMGMLMQFAAIQHKSFMQVFSSKVLTGQERAKLTAARFVMFGLKTGVPAGGIWFALAEDFSDEPEYQEMMAKMEGGLMDYMVNNTIDILMTDPDDIDPYEGRSNLSVSSALSPIPDTVPYWDAFVEIRKIWDGGKIGPKFPALGAGGALLDSIRDINTLFTAVDLESEEKLKMGFLEVVESMSGYNNFAKMLVINEFQDKKDKLGNSLGLSLTEADGVAQLFGITSKEEIDLYKLKDLQFERLGFIRDEAKKIHDGLWKLRDKIGTPDYLEWKRQQRTLLAFYPEEIREDIANEVDNMVKLNRQDKKQNVYNEIMRHYKMENDKYLREQIRILERSPAARDKELLKKLRRENIIGE